MKMAGGIIALIAGIFGVIAAIVTLFFGGLGSAVGAQGGDTVVWMGWAGLIFSFLTIVLGAIVLGVKSRVPGILLIISTILGAILGGTPVAICMVLAFIGGLLAVIGTKAVPVAQLSTDAAVTGQTAQKGGGAKIAFAIVGTLVVVLVGLAVIGMYISSKKTGSSDAGNQTASTTENESTDPITQLANAQPANVDPVALGKMFALGTDNTDLQRDEAFGQIKGKVVQWTLEVYEVQKDGDTDYQIQTQAGDAGNIDTFTHVTPRSEADRQTIMALKTGDKITVKGVISDTTMRSFELKPAILATSSVIAAATSPISRSVDEVTAAATDAAAGGTPATADAAAEAANAANTAVTAATDAAAAAEAGNAANAAAAQAAAASAVDHAETASAAIAQPVTKPQYKSMYSQCVNAAGEMDNGVADDCMSKVTASAKTAITTSYKKTYDELTVSDKSKAQQFEDSQKAWIKSRNAKCGTLTGLESDQCLMDMNVDRAVELQGAKTGSTSATANNTQSKIDASKQSCENIQRRFQTIFPNSKIEVPYPRVRAGLISSGWTPIPQAKDENEGTFSGIFRAAGFTEFGSCAGDRPLCVFHFKSKAGETLTVIAAYDELKDNKTANDFVVTSSDFNTPSCR